MKRIALVKISRETLAEIIFADSTGRLQHWEYLHEDTGKNKNKTPINLKVGGVQYIAHEDVLKVVFESPDFREVQEGGIIPEIIVIKK